MFCFLFNLFCTCFSGVFVYQPSLTKSLRQFVVLATFFVGLFLPGLVCAQTLSVDGTTLSVALSKSQSGDYTFTGAAGQRLGLGVNAVTTTTSGSRISIQIIRPDNSTTLIDCGYFYAAGGNCNLPMLPSDGTYTIRVAPYTVGDASSFNLTLSSDVTGVLTAGTVSTFTTSRMGQNGRYTFTATAGQDMTLLATTAGSTFNNSVGITVLNPSGSSWGSTTAKSGVRSNIQTFPPKKVISSPHDETIAD
jgi:hypothetical protein